MRGEVYEIYRVFEGSSKQLIIPVYQRNYDWQLKQCAQLFDDLVETIETDRKSHFFGRSSENVRDHSIL